MDKFDWLATESAPKGYPMRIVSGSFSYPGEGGLSVPDTKIIQKGWGQSISTHVVGAEQKPLPVSLDITFYSYTEDAFYQGYFELPYDKIHQLFSEGFYSLKTQQHATYRNIMVGVAPGGTVAVWLTGLDMITEVFMGKAEKTNVEWGRVLDNPEISRQDYIKEVLLEEIGDEEIKKIAKNGIPFDKWPNFHRRYRWVPQIKAINPPKVVQRVDYLNGERSYFFEPFSEKEVKATRAMPKELSFNWLSPAGKPLLFEVYFDESEVISAFEALLTNLDSENSKPLILEIMIEEGSKGRKVSLWLRKNEDEAIEFKNTQVKTYGEKRRYINKGLEEYLEQANE